jgi:hypothetical protein
MVMSRRMRWAGHVALIGFCWESQKERDHQEYQGVGGWILMKMDFRDRVG